jgi:hypothetical protein
MSIWRGFLLVLAVNLWPSVQRTVAFIIFSLHSFFATSIPSLRGWQDLCVLNTIELSGPILSFKILLRATEQNGLCRLNRPGEVQRRSNSKTQSNLFSDE